MTEYKPENYPQLNLPPAKFKFMREDGLLKVFDPIRKKYVNFTPEEYVRQSFVNFMTKYLKYPASIMVNEIAITLNDTRKRCDTVVFRPDATPLMIVEYKAPDVKIDQSTFDQIVRYNMKLHAKYLVVSNGLQHYCCVNDYEHNSYNFIPRIPEYSSIAFPFAEN